MAREFSSGRFSPGRQLLSAVQIEQNTYFRPAFQVYGLRNVNTYWINHQADPNQRQSEVMCADLLENYSTTERRPTRSPSKSPSRKRSPQKHVAFMMPESERQEVRTPSPQRRFPHSVEGSSPQPSRKTPPQCPHLYIQGASASSPTPYAKQTNVYRIDADAMDPNTPPRRVYLTDRQAQVNIKDLDFDTEVKQEYVKYSAMKGPYGSPRSPCSPRTGQGPAKNTRSPKGTNCSLADMVCPPQSHMPLDEARYISISRGYNINNMQDLNCSNNTYVYDICYGDGQEMDMNCCNNLTDESSQNKEKGEQALETSESLPDKGKEEQAIRANESSASKGKGVQAITENFVNDLCVAAGKSKDPVDVALRQLFFPDADSSNVPLGEHLTYLARRVLKSPESKTISPASNYYPSNSFFIDEVNCNNESFPPTQGIMETPESSYQAFSQEFNNYMANTQFPGATQMNSNNGSFPPALGVTETPQSKPYPAYSQELNNYLADAHFPGETQMKCCNRGFPPAQGVTETTVSTYQAFSQEPKYDLANALFIEEMNCSNGGFPPTQRVIEIPVSTHQAFSHEPNYDSTNALCIGETQMNCSNGTSLSTQGVMETPMSTYQTFSQEPNYDSANALFIEETQMNCNNGAFPSAQGVIETPTFSQEPNYDSANALFIEETQMNCNNGAFPSAQGVIETPESIYQAFSQEPKHYLAPALFVHEAQRNYSNDSFSPAHSKQTLYKHTSSPFPVTPEKNLPPRFKATVDKVIKTQRVIRGFEDKRYTATLAAKVKDGTPLDKAVKQVALARNSLSPKMSPKTSPRYDDRAVKEVASKIKPGTPLEEALIQIAKSRKPLLASPQSSPDVSSSNDGYLKAQTRLLVPPVNQKREISNPVPATGLTLDEIRQYSKEFNMHFKPEQQQHFAKTGNFLYHLYAHDRLSDVLLSLDEVSFSAHSAVVSAHSGHLANVLLSEKKPIYRIRLPNFITPSSLKVLLDYMYTGEVNIDAENSAEVLRGAVMLQMPRVEDACRKLLSNIETSKLLLVWEMAIKHHLPDIAARALKDCVSHFREVASSDAWLDLDLYRLMELLCHDDLVINSELDVARAGLRWLQCDHKRRQYTPEVMKSVRLVHLHRQELHDLMLTYPFLMSFSYTRQDFLNACWYLSCVEEGLPHLLGEFKMPHCRVKPFKNKVDINTNSNNTPQLIKHDKSLKTGSPRDSLDPRHAPKHVFRTTSVPPVNNGQQSRRSTPVKDVKTNVKVEALSPEAPVKDVKTNVRNEAQSPKALVKDIKTNFKVEALSPESPVKDIKTNVKVEALSPESPVKDIKTNVKVEALSPESPVKDVKTNVKNEAQSPKALVKDVKTNFKVEALSPESPVKDIKTNVKVEALSPESPVKDIKTNVKVEALSPESPVKDVKTNVKNEAQSPKALVKDVKTNIDVEAQSPKSPVKDVKTNVEAQSPKSPVNVRVQAQSPKSPVKDGKMNDRVQAQSPESPVKDSKINDRVQAHSPKSPVNDGRINDRVQAQSPESPVKDGKMNDRVQAQSPESPVKDGKMNDRVQAQSPESPVKDGKMNDRVQAQSPESPVKDGKTNAKNEAESPKAEPSKMPFSIYDRTSDYSVRLQRSPEEYELDAWGYGGSLRRVRVPSIGDTSPALRSFLDSRMEDTIIVIGGYDPSGQKYDAVAGLTMIGFDDKKKSWCLRGLLPEARVHHAAVYCNGAIYVIGGLNPLEAKAGLLVSSASVHVYDLTTAMWKEAPPMLSPRCHHSACVLDKCIYVVGGQDRELNVLSSVECYDTTLGRWKMVNPMPQGRLGPSVTCANGRVIVLGGCGLGLTPKDSKDFTIYDSVISYNPATDIWSELIHMRVSRCYATAVTDDFDIWLVGGVTPSKTFGNPICCSLSNLDCFMTSEETWRYLGDLTIPRHHATAAYLGGRVFVMGGLSTLTNCAVDTVEVYDTMSGKWDDTVTNLPRPLMGAKTVVVPELQSVCCASL